MSRRFHSRLATVNPESARRAFQQRLTRWYRRHRRRLPWRDTRDPYKIWISEIMLQQTRVTVVRNRYRRWLKTFPSVAALARAPRQRVLREWEGLGYYARAKNLRRAARQLRARPFQRCFRTSADLQRLPGIGPYTAAAIASIAFDERVPVVDGNVARVLARVFCIRDNVRQPATQRRLRVLAGSLMPATRAGEFNQALMELGALICAPLNPRCPACPLRNVCAARARGLVARLPNRGRSARPRHVRHHVAFVTCNGCVLVQRRPEAGLLAGLWELPALDPARFRAGRQLLRIEHTITNRRIHLRVFAARPRPGRTQRPAHAGHAARWVRADRLARLPFAAAHRRALDALLAGTDARPVLRTRPLQNRKSF
jgi:A/G-specific adenine glycosylase